MSWFPARSGHRNVIELNRLHLTLVARIEEIGNCLFQDKFNRTLNDRSQSFELSLRRSKWFSLGFQSTAGRFLQLPFLQLISSLQQFMWQLDIVGVAHFVMDCFDYLDAASPSNQP